MPKRREKSGTIQDVRSVMWEGIEMLEHYLLDPHERGEKINVHELTKLMHALSQAANTYARLIEAGEMEERLAALEAAQMGRAA